MKPDFSPFSDLTCSFLHFSCVWRGGVGVGGECKPTLWRALRKNLISLFTEYWAAWHEENH